MCGIIAYTGHHNAFPILVDGLKRLEYRGYDSFGILTSADTFDCVKVVGPVSTSSIRTLQDAPVGIAHTRWATHGGVTESNAHPHFSCDKRLAVVHNGVIENMQEIRTLIEGHTLVSQTDTELIVHLVEEFAKALPLKEAVRKAALAIKGRNSFIITEQGSDLLYACKRGSPLIIGIGEQEHYLASDLNALYGKTDKVMFLDDEEMAILDGTVAVYSLAIGLQLTKPTMRIAAQEHAADLGSNAHFMLKEILEQRTTCTKALAQDRGLVESIQARIAAADHLFLVGCGTANKVCLAASDLFLRKLPTFATPASELHNYANLITDKSVAIAVSQSGETADTLEAMQLCASKGAFCASVVNMQGSTMSRMYPTLFTHCGPEIAVASTKATTAQFIVLAALAGIDERSVIALQRQLDALLTPSYERGIKAVAERLIHAKNECLFIIGKDMDYATALEAGIKLQEVGYLNALCFTGGELKHGPLALITQGSPVIVIGDDPDLLTNAIEAKARGAHIIGIASTRQSIHDDFIASPTTIPELRFVAHLPPLQLLSYHVSIGKGINPDKPRNLAKSVTVK